PPLALPLLLPLTSILPLPAGACQQPPRFVFAEPSEPLKDSYAEGTALRYRCRPGYRMAPGKSAMVTCLSNSEWSADPNFCIEKSCPPPEIENGNFESATDLLFGATVTYTCNTGYRLVGASSAQCVVTGNEVSWDNIPYCTIIPCSPPPAIENGQYFDSNRDFVFASSVTYSCNQGFSLIGDAIIHCTTHDNLEGVWSGPPPECKIVRCEDPEVKNAKRLSGFGTQHTYKNSVSFECKPGYLMKGDSIVTCEADSTWKPPLPTCDPVYCGPAPSFPFAEAEGAVGNSFLAGTQLKYRCKPGYTAASGKSSFVTCMMDTTWSVDPDFCIRQQCPPPTIANGAVTADNFLFETVVIFTCHPGYELKGPSSAKCVLSGNGVAWNTTFPYCGRQLPDVLCEEPPVVDNGMHNGTQGTTFVPGSVVVYKCKDGFTLAGAASIHCEVDHQNRGVWSKPTPECKG
ncbi:CR1 protein, partial [Centropus unirufus]|nr:CR1 protein [Centropus unirufus]